MVAVLKTPYAIGFVFAVVLNLILPQDMDDPISLKGAVKTAPPA
jgi:hypothetical protein